MSGDESQSLTKASVACPDNEPHNEANLTTSSFVCPADNCGKKLKTKQTLSKHTDKFHKVSQLDSPARLALFRIREDGDDSSVQGNSKGEVNSPKVVTLARYACSICEKDYPKNEEVLKHIADEHSPENEVTTERDDDISGDEEELQDEQGLIDVLDAAAEEAAIYEALEMLTQKDFDPNTDEVDKKNLKEKLERYRNISIKKTNLQKKTSEQVKQLEEQIGYLKADAILREEVIENSKTTLDEKDKEIQDGNNQLKKTKEKLEKDKDALKKSLQEMQKEKGQMVKEKQDFKFEIQNSKSIIMSLKKKLEDEVSKQTIEEPEIQETARVIMNKDVSGNNCTACNKSFNKNQDLERHMNDKHSEKQCILCDQMCSSEIELVRHQAQCLDQGLQTEMCKGCNKNFNSYGMKKHHKVCHGEKRYTCPKCGELFKMAKEVKKHILEEHEEREAREKSREVCWHWRQGNCLKGDSCHFSHVGFQKDNSSNIQKRSTRSKTCHNGPQCQWKERGECRFFHPGVGVQNQKQMRGVQGERQHSGGQQGAQRQSSQRNQLCRWNENCFRKDTCKFVHTPSEDFPQRQNQSRHIGRNQNGRVHQRRN